MKNATLFEDEPRESLTVSSRSVLQCGDNRVLARELPFESIDAIVTDPPYGLSFMGAAWDKSVPGIDYWSRFLDVLKPGGYMVAFGGTRTFHRMAVAIEDAGFEIRDTLCWLYGSGFPKSLDVSKSIDKSAGATRTEGSREWSGGKRSGGIVRDNECAAVSTRTIFDTPATDAAKEWDGWGTALKPAWEPIILARKPIVGTVTENVLNYGVGGLNVDGCRIESIDETYARNCSGDRGHAGTRDSGRSTDLKPGGGTANELGRWPANVVLDEDAAEMLDASVGPLKSGGFPSRRSTPKFKNAFGEFEGDRESEVKRGPDDGGPSRFFYCAKASRAERNAGCDDLEETLLGWSSGDQSPGSFQSEGTNRLVRNDWPTVKPIALMRWLCRLITPPGGTILDPFTGSGSTGCAAELEGFSFIGFDENQRAIDIAKRRIAHWASLSNTLEELR